MFYCYILRSTTSGRHYVGHCEDLEQRLADHNRGHVVSTRNKGPWEIAYREPYEERLDAVRREHEIKSWKSAKRIRELIGRS